MRYLTFYSFHEEDDHVESEEGLRWKVEEIISELIPRLVPDDDFIGLVDEEDTALQFYIVEGDTFWVEIPDPKEKGSYGTQLGRADLLSLLSNLPQSFDHSDFPGFKFTRWE